MSSFRNLNKIQLIGNVGQEPKFHDYGDNQRLVRFSVATTESWKNKKTGEYEDDTTWHNVVVFNKFLVDMVDRHVTRGTMVYVEGAIKTRKFRKEGAEQDQYITEVVLSAFDGDIKVLVRETNVAASDGAAAAGETGGDPFNDDCPF
jgi:single-strand DNA-binding protein